MRFKLNRAIRAAGYGVLAGLGSTGLIDVPEPAAHGFIPHALLGLAVAAITYTERRALT